MFNKKRASMTASALIALILTAASFSILPASAESATSQPGAIVDYGTVWGYSDFLENVHRDTEHLFTGEYTVHGMDGKVDYIFNKEGYTTFTPKEPLDEKGKDANGRYQQGDWRMTGELEFDSSEYGFIAVKYRFSDRAHISQNHIYIRDDSHSGEFEGTTGMWVENGLVADGEWNVRILNISDELPSVKGTVKSIRIPIASRVGETFDIQYAAAFKTEEDALNFDYEAYKKTVADSHDDTDWEINEDGTIKWIPKATPESGSSVSPAPSGSSSEGGTGKTAIIICVCAAAVLVCAAAVILIVIRKKKSGK